MPPIDVPSLVLTNALMSLAMVAMLLVSRIGLGSEGHGIRSWVVGDLVMCLGRLSAVWTLLGRDNFVDPHFPSLAGACFVFGTACHLQALRRVAGQAAQPWRACGGALLLGLLFHGLLATTDDLVHRLQWMGAALAAAAVVTLWALRPLLGFWGARLIGSMMVLAIVTQVVHGLNLLLHLASNFPIAALSLPPGGVHPHTLLIDLVIAVFVTGGFLLLLQERLRQRIERLTVTDVLTGALNRRGLLPVLARSLAQAQRSGAPLSVVMFDLDHFKRVNDVHGHATGDLVLATFAAKVGANLRTGDALARWGGEEFLLLLPDTPLAGAVRQAERLRTLVGQARLAEGVPMVTISGGVAALEPPCDPGAEAAAGAQAAVSPGDTPALLRLLDAADRRLYLAKQQRNCVVGEDPPAELPAA